MVGVPYYSYSRIYPQNLMLIIKAPVLQHPYRSLIVTLIGPFKKGTLNPKPLNPHLGNFQQPGFRVFSSGPGEFRVPLNLSLKP